MKTISILDLMNKLEKNKSSFKLVNALDPYMFAQMHIPNSLNVSGREDIGNSLSLDDEIVVYCTNDMCHRSRVMYHKLEDMGFQNLRRFSGGLQEWSNMGLEFEKGLPETTANAA